MRKKIKVGKVYMREHICSNVHADAVRLCADVEMENPNTHSIGIKTLYFEFERKYKNDLCIERSDAFVVGLLTSAMENGMDIEFENPISERLFYQLTTNYIPMLSKYNPSKLKRIKLIGPYTNKAIENKGAVATGCSGGVDSFYTIIKHSPSKMIKEYQLTHLVFASCGTQDIKNERIEAYYNKYYPRMCELAVTIGCGCIGCFTNLHEFYKYPYKGFSNFFATIYGSVVFAIQRLLAVYYESSGDPITEFHIDLDKAHGHDGSVFDVFSVSCMNTENLIFYSSGADLTRIEKEKNIADDPIAQKYLTVCGLETSGYTTAHLGNCSKCTKCLRTMVQFYSMGKLDNFAEVFDLNEFYRNKYKYIGKMIAVNKKSYVRDTELEAKRNEVHLGIQSYLWAYLWYKPIKYLSKVFNNNLLARKIYYHFNIDYKLYGYRNAKYEVYKNKI